MKLTAAIAGAYWGAQIKYKGDVYKVFNFLREGHMHLWNSPTCFLEDVPIKDCQLLLTPLSKISDEDLVQIAVMLNHKQAHDLDELKENILEYRDKFIDVIQNKESKQIAENDISPIAHREVYDYLRSKGYDCGHGSIPNLTAAGVAVEKK